MSAVRNMEMKRNSSGCAGNPESIWEWIPNEKELIGNLKTYDKAPENLKLEFSHVIKKKFCTWESNKQLHVVSMKDSDSRFRVIC